MLTHIKWGHVTENALFCVVNSVFAVFLRNIHSDKRFLGTPPLFRWRNRKIYFFVVKRQPFLVFNLKLWASEN